MTSAEEARRRRGQRRAQAYNCFDVSPAPSSGANQRARGGSSLPRAPREIARGRPEAERKETPRRARARLVGLPGAVTVAGAGPQAAERAPLGALLVGDGRLRKVSAALGVRGAGGCSSSRQHPQNGLPRGPASGQTDACRGDSFAPIENLSCVLGRAPEEPGSLPRFVIFGRWRTVSAPRFLRLPSTAGPSCPARWLRRPRGWGSGGRGGDTCKS